MVEPETCIIGIGASAQHGRFVAGCTPMGLLAEASKNALADAGMTIRDVDGVMTSGDASVFNHSVAFAEYMGIETKFSTTIGLGGASAVASVLHASRAIKAGLCHTVLIANGGGGSRALKVDEARQRAAMVARMAGLGHAQFEIPYGPLLISQYALAAQRHMYEYGTTSRQLAEIAVQTRRFASLNEGSQMSTPITTEDVLNSPWISEPLHLLDCCLISQGAAALIVTSREGAQRSPNTPVDILGGGEGHRNEYISSMRDLTTSGTKEAAEVAFRTAGLTPADVDFAEIYDCFTITVLMDLEDLGFCAKGEGGPFVEDGRIGPGGDLPVNTHGGLLSYCHIGGIFHITEAAAQLRGESGPRQVPQAEIGLVTGNGGFLSTKSVMILGKGD